MTTETNIPTELGSMAAGQGLSIISDGRDYALVDARDGLPMFGNDDRGSRCYADLDQIKEALRSGAYTVGTGPLPR